MRFELVNHYEEVVENVVQFNTDLDAETDLITQLGQFAHWYYIEELDLFGPSKFVGYCKMNTELYDFGFGKNGGDTERVLNRWFLKLLSASSQGQNLRLKLEARLADFKKKPRKNCVIHIKRNAGKK